MLPKLDGYGVCEYIRNTSGIPIIMLIYPEIESEIFLPRFHSSDKSYKSIPRWNRIGI